MQQIFAIACQSGIRPAAESPPPNFFAKMGFEQLQPFARRQKKAAQIFALAVPGFRELRSHLQKQKMAFREVERQKYPHRKWKKPTRQQQQQQKIVGGGQIFALARRDGISRVTSPLAKMAFGEVERQNVPT